MVTRTRFGEALGRWTPSVSEWVWERVERVPDDGRPAREWTTTRELYQDYSDWKLRRFELPADIRRWGMAMKAIGFQKKKAGVSRYIGVKLVSDLEGGQ